MQVAESTAHESTVSADAAACAAAAGAETLEDVWPAAMADKLGYVAAHHPEDKPARE